MRIFSRKEKDSKNEFESFKKIIDNVRDAIEMCKGKAQDELNKAVFKKKTVDLKGAVLCMKKRKLYEKKIMELERSFMCISDQELEYAYEDQKNDKIAPPLILSSNSDDELLNELNSLETKETLSSLP